MGNKLLHANWGDDRDLTTKEIIDSQRQCWRRGFWVGVIVTILLAFIANEVLHHYWPARDCVQIGEYTCVERLP